IEKNLNSLVTSIDTSCTLTNYIDLAKDVSINIVHTHQMYCYSLVEVLKQYQSSSVIYTFTDLPERSLLRNKHALVYLFVDLQMKKNLFKDPIDRLDATDGGMDLASISGGLSYPITNEGRPVISEVILRRLESTKLQTLLISKSNSASAAFQVDSCIDELHLVISSMGKYKNRFSPTRSRHS
ncbi:unnamed protein product, partial [Rotaria magnacalcarata]